jgi:hypothetical protein
MEASFKADGGAIFPLDLITHLVAKRALSTSTAFASLVEQHNMICARTLLRTQIDSVIRLNAFSLVDEPHELALKMLAGQHIRRLKDRYGQKMTDTYLVEKLGKDIEWLARVYDRTSGFIHLSDELIGLTAVEVKPSGFIVAIVETDAMPEGAWEEVIKCFLETSHLLLHFIDAWVERKNFVATERKRNVS